MITVCTGKNIYGASKVKVAGLSIWLIKTVFMLYFGCRLHRDNSDWIVTADSKPKILFRFSIGPMFFK